MVKWIEIVSGFWPDTNTGRKFNRFFAPGMRSNALPCFMAKINFPPKAGNKQTETERKPWRSGNVGEKTVECIEFLPWILELKANQQAPVRFC